MLRKLITKGNIAPVGVVGEYQFACAGADAAGCTETYAGKILHFEAGHTGNSLRRIRDILDDVLKPFPSRNGMAADDVERESSNIADNININSFFFFITNLSFVCKTIQFCY